MIIGAGLLFAFAFGLFLGECLNHAKEDTANARLCVGSMAIAILLLGVKFCMYASQ